MDAYKKQLGYFIDLKIRANNIIERLYANYMPAPFMSIVMDDCIARGLIITTAAQGIIQPISRALVSALQPMRWRQ